MMRMKGKIQHIVISLGIILFLMAPAEGFAQQDPMYTQYMFNTQTITPAYAGSWESIGFMIMSRMQWAGIELLQRKPFHSKCLYATRGLGLAPIW